MRSSRMSRSSPRTFSSSAFTFSRSARIGTVVIVTGTVLLSGRGQRVGFRAWDIVFPLLSAACFGAVTVLRKIGLAQIGPAFGTAVNVTTALVAFTAFLLASGRGAIATCRGPSLTYFIAAGAAENAAVFLNILALSVGAESVDFDRLEKPLALIRLDPHLHPHRQHALSSMSLDAPLGPG